MTANGTLGLILAGGRGSRIGGRDKAWLRLAGRPLLCHARERLAGQVDSVAISANRHLWCYRSLGLVATPDPPPWRHCGPLAGIATALATYPHTYLAVVPVDVPMAPRNHVAVLARALAAGAVAAALHDGVRRQPLFALMHRSLAPAAAAALSAASPPSMQAWLSAVGATWVTWAGAGLEFANINSPQDLDRLARQIDSQ